MTPVLRFVKGVAACALVVLVLLLALVVARCVAASRDPGRAVGGADVVGEANDGGHQIGRALHDYALQMGDDVIGGDDWEAQNGSAAPLGGAARRHASGPKPRRHWSRYSHWKALVADRGAELQYLRDRARALNELRFDWSAVLSTAAPLLREDREYIGLIGAPETADETDTPNGAPTLLHVTAAEASPIRVGEDKNPNVFASVPARLVEEVSSRTALFIWHSHPDDSRGSPLPSPADVSTAISMAYAGIYAANIVISRFGICLYTLDPFAEARIRASADPGLAMRNLRFDAVSALNSMRSWTEWSLDDFRALFARYGILYVVWPSTDYVAAATRLRYSSNLLQPTDFDLLDELRKAIEEYEGRKGHERKPAHKRIRHN